MNYLKILIKDILTFPLIEFFKIFFNHENLKSINQENIKKYVTNYTTLKTETIFMNKEYVVISKTDIEEKIDELKKPISNYDGIYVSDEQIAKYQSLEEVLTNSTPLIKLISDAYEAGRQHDRLSLSFDDPKGRFISHLGIK